MVIPYVSGIKLITVRQRPFLFEREWASIYHACPLSVGRCHIFFFGYTESYEITPAAQGGAAGSVRLLLTKNPAGCRGSAVSRLNGSRDPGRCPLHVLLWFPHDVPSLTVLTWLMTVLSASPSGKLCAVVCSTRVAAPSNRVTLGSAPSGSATPRSALSSLRRRSRRLMTARNESWAESKDIEKRRSKR